MKVSGPTKVCCLLFGVWYAYAWLLPRLFGGPRWTWRLTLSGWSTRIWLVGHDKSFHDVNQFCKFFPQWEEWGGGGEGGVSAKGENISQFSFSRIFNDSVSREYFSILFLENMFVNIFWPIGSVHYIIIIHHYQFYSLPPPPTKLVQKLSQKSQIGTFWTTHL